MADRRQLVDLDDKQQARHTYQTMADHAELVHNALFQRGFTEELVNAMMLAWWQQTLAASYSPNLESIMRNIVGDQE
jgi:hypothetical protein